MAELLAIIFMGIIIIGQGVERYLYAKEMNRQLENANKAVMSRNINEYLTATQEPKKETGFVESDEVEIANATDEEFDKHIQNQ